MYRVPSEYLDFITGGPELSYNKVSIPGRTNSIFVRTRISVVGAILKSIFTKVKQYKSAINFLSFCLKSLLGKPEKKNTL